MAKKGFFIVLEGTDGSGKTEQFKRRLKRIKKQGLQCRILDFPRYGQPSAYFVENYLKGKYGQWQQVDPYQASLFYALDRFEVSLKIKKWLAQGNIILSNRYIASNLGHQGAKISAKGAAPAGGQGSAAGGKNRKDRKKFFLWVNNLEYKILQIPKPNLNIFLHLPAEIAFELIKKREKEVAKKRDIHENLDHLRKAEKTYLEVVKLFSKDFMIVECSQQKKILSREEIEEKIWAIVRRKLEKIYGPKKRFYKN